MNTTAQHHPPPTTHLLLLEGVPCADVCTYPRRQLSTLEGLWDVVISTTAQPLNDILLLCFG
jgi:hypothetical protein